MAGHAAIGVDDDLAAGQAAVTHGATHHELARGVDVEGDAVVPHPEVLEHGLDDLARDLLVQQFLRDILDVLAGHHHGVHAHGRDAVVAHAHLRLAVGQQEGHGGAPHRGQALGNAVREHDGQRHEHRRLIACEPEHQALVAGALLVVAILLAVRALLEGAVHALCDVGALLVERHGHAARVRVEAVLRVHVADVGDGVAHHGGDVHLGGRGHLTRDHHLAGRDEGLARDPRRRVLRQHRVEDAIRDLVGDLVRVALGDGLRGEQVLAHAAPCRWIQRGTLPTAPRHAKRAPRGRGALTHAVPRGVRSTSPCPRPPRPWGCPPPWPRRPPA